MWRLLLGRQATATMKRAPSSLVRPRSALQKLAANDAVEKSLPKSLQTSNVTPMLSFCQQQQRFLSIRGQEATSQNYPPRIQSWLDRKSPVELSTEGAVKAREKLLIHREQLLDEITRDDPSWLEEVVKEIRRDVLVGTMSEPVRNLAHTLMRWLRTQGYMAQIVEDLLMRLIEEEDSGAGICVNAVLYSIAIDAWAKQYSCSDAPQRAEALFQLMQDRYKAKPSQRPAPRASHVSQVLVAWSNSSLPHAPQRAEQLLQWMENESNKFPPSVHAYTSVIHAYSRHGKANDAERILRLMEARLEDDPQNAVRPNVKTFTAVISAWATAGQGKRGAHMAEAVRQRLEQWYDRLEDDDLKPNVKLLTALMQAWSKSNSPEQGEKADAIWQEIVELRESLSKEERNMSSNELNIFPHNIRMEAWSKIGKAEKAEEILNGMLDSVKRKEKNGVAPTNISWAAVAHAWARIGDVKRTEDVLKRMHEEYCAGHSLAKRSVVIYNALLLAWLKSKDPLAASKAQRLLDWMEEQANSGIEELRPNEVSYDLVISGWRANRQTGRSGKIALELLSRMENYLKTHPSISDSAVASAYTMALLTLTRENKADTHLKILKLLHHMEATQKSGCIGPVLTNHCYHIAIASCAWAPNRDGEQVAEDILLSMEASKHKEFRPRRRSYEATIAGWARSFRDEAPARANAILTRLEERTEEEPDSPYEPSSKSYNYILAACLASRTPEAPDIARDVLEKIRKKKENGDETMRPSTGTFKLLFGDRFDQRDAMSATPVEEMITRMENANHDETVDERFLFDCYLYALTVWGWSVDHEAVTHAERLWEQMNASSHVSPSLVCFNSLLRAYTNSFERKEPVEGLAHKADELLRKMEREYSLGNIGWRPDSTSYDCVIDIWAKSKLPGAPERAFQLLERMDSSYKTFDSDHVKPSDNTYAVVLLACALTPAPDDETKLHHLNLAVRAFNHLRESEYGEPNRALYNRLLMCAIHLAPDHKTRVKMTNHIFSMCCRSGHVDKRIFKRYWTVAPKEERRQLLGRDDDKVELSDLPKEWTKNATLLEQS